jgi:hypothetical protein
VVQEQGLLEAAVETEAVVDTQRVAEAELVAAGRLKHLPLANAYSKIVLDMSLFSWQSLVTWRMAGSTILLRRSA